MQTLNNIFSKNRLTKKKNIGNVLIINNVFNCNMSDHLNDHTFVEEIIKIINMQYKDKTSFFDVIVCVKNIKSIKNDFKDINVCSNPIIQNPEKKEDCTKCNINFRSTINDMLQMKMIRYNDTYTIGTTMKLISLLENPQYIIKYKNNMTKTVNSNASSYLNYYPYVIHIDIEQICIDKVNYEAYSAFNISHKYTPKLQLISDNDKFSDENLGKYDTGLYTAILTGLKKKYNNKIPKETNIFVCGISGDKHLLHTVIDGAKISAIKMSKSEDMNNVIPKPTFFFITKNGSRFIENNLLQQKYLIKSNIDLYQVNDQDNIIKLFENTTNLYDQPLIVENNDTTILTNNINRKITNPEVEISVPLDKTNGKIFSVMVRLIDNFKAFSLLHEYSFLGGSYNYTNKGFYLNFI